MTMSTVNRPNGSNVTLSDFAEYAKDWNNIGRGKAIHLEGANIQGLKFNSNSGDERWIKHTPLNQRKNNAIRNAFLNALKRETGLDVNEFPKALKSVLNISDFGLVNNEADSGKPLTAYRINAVCTVLKSDKVQNEIAKIKGQKCIDRMKAITDRAFINSIADGDPNVVKTCLQRINQGVERMVGYFTTTVEQLIIPGTINFSFSKVKGQGLMRTLESFLEKELNGAYAGSGLRDAQEERFANNNFVVLGSSGKVSISNLSSKERIQTRDRDIIKAKLDSIKQELLDEYQRVCQYMEMKYAPKNS